jgi:oligopeptide/dipeptide ABC transporter ATP-binding protein
MTQEPLLRVDALRIEFPRSEQWVVAVNDVSLAVHEGECLGIVGESGSGKSVTGLAVLNLVPPPGRITGGRVLFEGKNLLELSEAEMRRVRGTDVSMIFQDPSSALNPLFTVRKQLTDVIRAHRDCGRKEAEERALEVLSMVEFPDPPQRIGAYPFELSGGLRQRVAIAMALAGGSRLVIADEPTTNLDVSVQSQIVDLFESLRDRLGLAVIFISHDLGLVANVAERVMVMYAGHAVEVGPTSSVLAEPAHPYTIGLLHSAPTLASRRTERLKAIPGNIPDLRDLPPGAPFTSRCPVAVDGVCREVKPGWSRAGDHHWVACHRFERDGRGGTRWAL